MNIIGGGSTLQSANSAAQNAEATDRSNTGDSVLPEGSPVQEFQSANQNPSLLDQDKASTQQNVSTRWNLSSETSLGSAQQSAEGVGEGQANSRSSVQPGDPVASVQGKPLASKIVYYSFKPANTELIGGLSGETLLTTEWTPDQIKQVELAMSKFSDVADLKFVRATGTQEPTWEFHIADLSKEIDPSTGRPAAGSMEPPRDDGIPQMAVFDIAALTKKAGNDSGVPQIGEIGFTTLLHEIGHGLGLAHPFDNGQDSQIMQGVTFENGSFTKGDFDLNQAAFTMMSYNSGWAGNGSNASAAFGGMKGPAALDIAALQNMYGANTAASDDDDVYVMDDENKTGSGFEAIWDTGGFDELVYNGKNNAMLDLRTATLQYEEGGGGNVSFAGNSAAGVTFAAGVTIEAATGSVGDDIFFGNDANNHLTGKLGDDTFIGNEGIDTMDGGGGSDTANYSAETGDQGVVVNLAEEFGYDTHGWTDLYTSVENVVGTKHNDSLTGSDDHNNLFGLGGADFLDGGLGNDKLAGGEGKDVLIGGLGRNILQGGLDKDTFVITEKSGLDAITDFVPGVDIIDLSHYAKDGVNSFSDLSLSPYATTDQELGSGTQLVVEGKRVLIHNLTPDQLSASDFTFHPAETRRGDLDPNDPNHPDNVDIHGPVAPNEAVAGGNGSGGGSAPSGPDGVAGAGDFGSPEGSQGYGDGTGHGSGGPWTPPPSDKKEDDDDDDVA